MNNWLNKMTTISLNIWGSEYNTIPNQLSFVGFGGLSDRLIVWTPLFFLTPGCVSISLVVQK